MKKINIDKRELEQIFSALDANELFPSIVSMLSERGMSVATAESCTGGLIGKMITDVPGASAVFVGGMITYTNRVKIGKLGVSEKTIADHTEVSAECACEMADRAKALFESSVGISATGFAGPTGGNERDEVGTVYLGISLDKETFVYRLCFGALSRDEIRTKAALFAAKALADLTKNS